MKNIHLILLIVIAFIINTSCSYKNIYSSPTITQLDVDDYIKKIKSTDDLIIIDVRTPAEFKKGHYPSALNISLIKNFKQEIAKLDTSKTVFLYCETAHRSPYATDFLKDKGFTKIYDLKKGYSQIRKKITIK